MLLFHYCRLLPVIAEKKSTNNPVEIPNKGKVILFPVSLINIKSLSPNHR